MVRTLRLIAALLFMIQAVYIYSEDEIDISKISLEDFLKIEVSFASKTKETVSDAPSSVTVFTRKDIVNMGIQYLEELIQFVPGFQSQLQISGGSSTTIQVRGKPENGYLSKDVLVLLDGVRMNDATTGGSSLLNRFTTLENVEQVEIIRGPGSALYGTNAYLGVINIVTVKNINETLIRFGSFEETSVSMNFHQDVGPWSFTCFLRSYRDQGDTHFIPVDFVGNSGTAKDPQETINIHTKIQYKNFSFAFGKLDQELPDYMGGIAVGGEGINGNIQKQDLYSATYSQKLNENLNLTISAASVVGKERMVWNWSSLEMIFGAYIKVYNDNLNIDLDYAFNDRNSLSVGLSREIRGITDNAIIGNEGTKIVYYRGDGGITVNRDQKVTALYIQDQHRFSDAIKLITGVRYDDYSDSDDATNPRAAFIFDTPGNGKIKLMYGSAFLAPTNSEQYQRNTTASNGNPNLLPEKVNTTELAYNHSLSWLNTMLTYYQSSISNKIELIQDVNSPINTIPVNQGKVELKGLEVEFQSSFSDALFLRGAYSKQFDDIDIWSSGETFSLSLNLSQKAWGLNVNGYYQSGVEKVAAVQGGTAILNALGRWTPTKKIDFRLNITNLLDREVWYPDAPFTDHPGEIQSNRSRSIEISATYHY